MKDKEIRGKVLQKFYDHRSAGDLAINVEGMPRLEVEGVTEQEVLRICDQLNEKGLIRWKGYEDASTSDWFAGVGRISSYGVDVIDGDDESPIPLQFDQHSHVQNIHFAGPASGVQIAGAHSQQSQSLVQEMEKLIGAINDTSVDEADKREAKSKLARFLESKAAAAILGGAVSGLIKLCVP